MTHVLRNARVFLGGLEVTPQMNSVAMNYEAEVLDCTTFVAGADAATRSYRPGLTTAGVQVEGFYSVAQDALLFANIGATAGPLATPAGWSVQSGGGTIHSPCALVASGEGSWALESDMRQYQKGATVGALLGMSLGIAGEIPYRLKGLYTLASTGDAAVMADIPDNFNLNGAVVLSIASADARNANIDIRDADGTPQHRIRIVGRGGVIYRLDTASTIPDGQVRFTYTGAKAANEGGTVMVGIW